MKNILIYKFFLRTKKETLITTDYKRKETIHIPAWLTPLIFGYDKSMVNSWEEKIIKNVLGTIESEGIKEIEGDVEIKDFLLENYG